MSLSYYAYQVLYVYSAGYSFGYSPVLMWTYFFSLSCWLYRANICCTNNAIMKAAFPLSMSY